MKRRLSLLLAAAMTAGMLAGCGNQSSETKSGADNAENTGGTQEQQEEQQESQEGGQEEAQGDGEVTQVTFWNCQSGEKAFVDQIVEEFNTTIGKENHVEIVLEHVESANSEQETEVALQNGAGPDIVLIRDLSKYAENGWIAPLTEVPGLEELVEKNDLRSVGNSGNVWQDKMYMIPEGRSIFGLAYNKDLFVEAGIVDENGEAKPPATIAEMVEDAKLLTDPGKQQFGFGFPLGWTGAIATFYLNLPSQSSSGLIGGIYDYKTGQYDFNGIKDMTAAVLQMKEDQTLYPGAESLDNDAARARFAENSIGMMMTVQWDCAVWNDQFPAKCDWGIAPIPVADTSSAYQQVSDIYWSYGIGAKGIEEGRGDAIALVYNYLYGDEMLVRRAEEGIRIPYRADIVEMCDFSNSPKGWGAYCELAGISCLDVYNKKEVQLDGVDDCEVSFVNDLWSGRQTLDEWIKTMTDRYNEGAEAFIENATEDVAAEMQGRMDPNFDISR